VIRLTFHGGARSVTGSRHLLEVGTDRLLLDCGLHQGLKALRERNWAAPGFEPRTVGALVLTHAHIDHTGWVPRLVRLGFRGPIYCTRPTSELADFMLRDAARLQEEDAEYLNRKKLTKHDPALPLYEEADVEQALPLFRPVAEGAWTRVSEHYEFRLINVGHLLGSAMAQVRVTDEGKSTTVLFTGDVGRPHMPMVPDPDPPPASDYLICESTYGDRCHCNTDIAPQIAEVAERVLRRKGILLVPAFAVGRAQQMIYLLRQLTVSGRIPKATIYLDSPMALEATKLYRKYYSQDWDPTDPALPDGTELSGDQVRLVRSQQESRALNDLRGPAVVISSSGMLAGGRILHHLAHHLGDRDNFILLTGYQAEGTRGRALADGARSIRIHGQDIGVRAEVGTVHGLSGHADYHELQRWLKDFPVPKRTFLVHGEATQAEGLARRLTETRGFACTVPDLNDSFLVDAY